MCKKVIYAKSTFVCVPCASAMRSTQIGIDYGIFWSSHVFQFASFIALLTLLFFWLFFFSPTVWFLPISSTNNLKSCAILDYQSSLPSYCSFSLSCTNPSPEKCFILSPFICPLLDFLFWREKLLTLTNHFTLLSYKLKDSYVWFC